MHFHKIKEKYGIRLFYSAIEPDEDLNVSLELYYWDQNPSFSFRQYGIGDDHCWTFHIGFILGFYLSVSHPWFRRKIEDDNQYDDRALSFCFFEYTIQWNLWTFENGNDHGFLDGSFDIRDILGRLEIQTIPSIESSSSFVKMPEGWYPCTINSETVIHKRKFWFPRKYEYTNLTLDAGFSICFPGKGENSWDCGDDGCSSFHKQSLISNMGIVNEFILCIMKYRNWNFDWYPSEDWAQLNFSKSLQVKQQRLNQQT